MTLEAGKHKLLITSEIRRGELFEKFLHPYQVARDELFWVKLKVENMGDKEFPGGKAAFTIRHSQVGWRKPQEIELKGIAVGEAVDLPERTAMVVASGLAWMELRVEAADGGKIAYFHNRTGSPLELDYWSHPLSVVDRETLMVLKLLEEIKEELTRR